MLVVAGGGAAAPRHGSKGASRQTRLGRGALTMAAPIELAVLQCIVL